jgi:tRNA(fMet)-specific endonuclease VapC
MSAIMLDSDICIFAMRGRPASVVRRLERTAPGNVVLSSISAAELWTGVAKSVNREKNREKLMRFLGGVRILDWPGSAAIRYAAIRAYLELRGSRIGEMDLLIGAHALHEDLPLVTNNAKEFRRVPGLIVESWIR